MVELLPFFTKDTSDVLMKIANIHLEKDMWLATCDVESLFTSITHVDGLEAVQAFLIMNAMYDDLSEFLLDRL